MDIISKTSPTVHTPPPLWQLDIAKIFMALAVIYIHVEPFHVLWPALNSILLCFAHSSVAAFFAISGFLLTYRQQDFHLTGRVAQKFLLRIGRMYLLWAVPCDILLWLSGISPGNIFVQTIFGVMHLWFLVGMIQIICLMYLWQRFLPIKYLMLPGLLLYTAVTLATTYWQQIPIGNLYWMLLRSGLGYGLFFFVMGMYIAPLAQRFSRCQSSFLLLSAVLVQLAEILLLMDGQAAFHGYDFFLSQLLIVPALLIFLTQWQLKGQIWPRLCPFLRRSSIFIYCFHGQLVVYFLLLCPEQLDKLAASLSIDIFILRSILGNHYPSGQYTGELAKIGMSKCAPQATQLSSTR